jgi:hypothetical protein
VRTASSVTKRAMQSSRETMTILALAFLLALSMSPGIDEAAAQSVFDLSATDVTIFDPDGGVAIGQGHYNLSHVGGVDVVEGENKYLNGEYDREEQSVKPAVRGMPPVLVNFQHQFFNPDGSMQYTDSLDARTGHAACRRFDSSPPDVRETTLEVPADTYAGSAQLMFVVGRLRGAAVKIRFHSFNCIPDPRIIAIKATPLSGLVPWSMYPGKLVKIEMTPDFGWLNIFIAPFIPRIYGWFDPADRFQFVGGQFDRYYKGRHILMVRAREAKPAVQRSTSLRSDH